MRFRLLLLTLAGWIGRQQQDAIDCLVEENRVLKERPKASNGRFDVSEAAARLLSSAGCEVIVPPSQACCGALHAHAGDLDGARRLLLTNLEAFGDAGPLDAIVVTSAGCGSALKESARLLQHDPEMLPRARALAALVRDALELLDELGLPPASVSIGASNPPRPSLRNIVIYPSVLGSATTAISGIKSLLKSSPMRS